MNRDDIAEFASDARLRAELEDAYDRAHELREFREALVRKHVSVLEWTLIEDYAQAKAAEILARRAMEECGWMP